MRLTALPCLVQFSLAPVRWVADPFRDPKRPPEERVNNLVSLLAFDE
jgi:hypothetical protein